MKYVTEKRVSEISGLALQTLRNYRMIGQGPAYVKLGRAVRYSESDVIEWIEQHKIYPGEMLSSQIGDDR